MAMDPRLYTSDRRSFQGIIKTLLVGPLEVKFVVHEDILRKDSPFFASACKEEWKEGREHEIPLRGDGPSVVDLYLQWIYTGRIFSRPSDEGGSEGEEELSTLVEGFIFGEKVQNGDFKDAIVDAIVSSFPVTTTKKKSIALRRRYAWTRPMEELPKGRHFGTC